MRGSTAVSAALALLLASAAVLSGCSAVAVHVASQPAIAPQQLLGTWYDARTGAQYRFVSDRLLVLPRRVFGGNAVAYTFSPPNSIDVVVGGAHHAIVVKKLTAEELVLTDPVTGVDQSLARGLGSSAFAKRLAWQAKQHAASIASFTADPTIVLAAKPPKGPASEWTTWSPSSLDDYAMAWDWRTLRRVSAPVATSGGGAEAGYSFTFVRQVPKASDMATAQANASEILTSGAHYVDVGYSATKADYPAGTLVYLGGGFIYSLGDGYAIAVTTDSVNKAFVPVTHK